MLYLSFHSFPQLLPTHFAAPVPQPPHMQTAYNLISGGVLVLVMCRLLVSVMKWQARHTNLPT